MSDGDGLAARFAALGAGMLAVVVLSAAAAGAGVAALLGGGVTPASAAATGQIPAGMLALYQRAAATCPGLPWTVLAGIGAIETDHGRAADQVSSAGAVGPMQFLPSTFAAYDQPVPSGGVDPPTPWDPVDAVYAAARLLCANGARNGDNLPGAVYAYNHSDAYVRKVLALARNYRTSDAQAVAAGTAPGIALDYALAQLGTPYRWGGDGPVAIP